jgi:Protein of unknown function (DUF3303)
MFFLVIEHFKNGDSTPIRERIVRDGQMMPVDLVYHESWVDPVNARCFQIMETGDVAFLRQWMGNWEDLIDFEVIPVMPWKEYWSLTANTP